MFENETALSAPPKSNAEPFMKKSAPLILSGPAVFDPFHFFKNLIRMHI